jgi:hypothetical protein
MAQQQILLLIVVSIVIGIATVIAIGVAGKGADQANRDAVRQDLANAASYVQAIWERPHLMGGASRRFTNLDEERILQYLNIPATNYQPGDSEATNSNGTYRVQLVEDNDTQLMIIGTPTSGPPDIQITVSRDDQTGLWTYVFSDVED